MLSSQKEEIPKKYPIEKGKKYNSKLFRFVEKNMLDLINKNSIVDENGWHIIGNNKEIQKNIRKYDEIINHIKKTIEEIFDKQQLVVSKNGYIKVASLPQAIQKNINSINDMVTKDHVFNKILEKLQKDKKIEDAINKNEISEEEILENIEIYFNDKEHIKFDDPIENNDENYLNEKEIEQIIQELSRTIICKYTNFDQTYLWFDDKHISIFSIKGQNPLQFHDKCVYAEEAKITEEIVYKTIEDLLLKKYEEEGKINWFNDHKQEILENINDEFMLKIKNDLITKNINLFNFLLKNMFPIFNKHYSFNVSLINLSLPLKKDERKKSECISEISSMLANQYYEKIFDCYCVNDDTPSSIAEFLFSKMEEKWDRWISYLYVIIEEIDCSIRKNVSWKYSNEHKDFIPFLVKENNGKNITPNDISEIVMEDIKEQFKAWTYSPFTNDIHLKRIINEYLAHAINKEQKTNYLYKTINEILDKTEILQKCENDWYYTNRVDFKSDNNKKNEYLFLYTVCWPFETRSNIHLRDKEKMINFIVQKIKEEIKPDDLKICFPETDDINKKLKILVASYFDDWFDKNLFYIAEEYPMEKNENDEIDNYIKEQINGWLKNTKFKKLDDSVQLNKGKEKINYCSFLYKSLPKVIKDEIKKRSEKGEYLIWTEFIYFNELIEIITDLLVQNNELILKKYWTKEEQQHKYKLSMFVKKIMFDLVSKFKIADKDGLFIMDYEVQRKKDKKSKQRKKNKERQQRRKRAK